MLSNTTGNKLNMYVPNYVVFDLETTGVSPSSDEVIEISAIKVVNGQVASEFSTLVNPGRHIPYFASEVNGITDDMVKDAPCFEKALHDFLTFTGDMVLVGHNIHTFDMKFIYRDAVKYFGKTIGNDYADTLYLARAVYPKLSCHKLTFLSDYLGVSTEGAHRALNDCRMTQVLFEKIGEEMRKGASGNVRICAKCGSPMVRRNGVRGPFWGCMSYPACRNTMDL